MEGRLSSFHHKCLCFKVIVGYAGFVQDLCIMGRKKSRSTILVAENVYIKKQGQSDAWHYYFAIDGKQFRKSTKTENDAKARQIALNAYHEILEKKHSGKVVARISFRKLSQKYLESIKGQTKHKFHSETLKRHFIGFFGKYDDISKINAGVLHDYLIWRREKSSGKILPQSLNKENVVFNQMMQLAVDYDWLNKAYRIKRQSEAQTQNRRSHFTHEEYDRLLAVSRKRAHELGSAKLTAKQRGYYTTRHWNRNLLHDLIIVLANSGMRVDEIKTVTWRNVDWENSKITLNRAGKVKSSRVVMVRGYGMRALERIRNRRLDHIKKHNLSELKDNELVQSLPNGVFINSLKKSFNTLLTACGFEYADIKDKHTLTSLRHTYATLRLTAKKGKRATMKALSRQMGTSYRMIEKNYGHDEIEDYQDQLMG